MSTAPPCIAVNTRLLLPGRVEGISRFAAEVLQRLVKTHPEVQFHFFFDRAYDPGYVLGENVHPHVVFPQARHPVLWYLWFHQQLRIRLNKLQPDVFFSPEFYLSPGANVPQVPVFHDLAYEHFPEDIGKWAARYCQKYSPQYAELANHILTVSEYSRQDLVQQYGLSENKISVVYNGANESFHPVSLPTQQTVRDAYTEGSPYFLFVGTLQPRKNIAQLLKAFDQFKREKDSPVRLLIVGRKGWKYEEAMLTYEGMHFRDQVHFTGFVSDKELVKLYGSALALCYVPYLEGFGIPVLEAMACEVPVMCSNSSSLPEVAGEAALLVDPYSPEQMVTAMHRLALDEELRTSLIEKGKVQRQQFSWKESAEKVWEILERYL